MTGSASGLAGDGGTVCAGAGIVAAANRTIINADERKRLKEQDLVFIHSGSVGKGGAGQVKLLL